MKRCASEQSAIKKNYASVINRIRSLAMKLRRKQQACTLVRASNNKLQAASVKLQATSLKHQASSSKLVKHQATSFKPQATSFKLQAASIKLQDPGPFVKFHAPRTEVLNADESIVWMLHMEGYLMWTEAYLVTSCDF